MPSEFRSYLSQFDRYISGFGGHIATSVYRLLSQSLSGIFVELAMVDVVGISTLSFWRYKYNQFSRPYHYFRLSAIVVITCRLLFELSMVVNPRSIVGILMMYLIVSET